MYKVVFKNLEKSELAREAAMQRMDFVVKRFPDLNESQITLTLEMENSPQQAGPDLFRVSFHVKGGRYRDVRLEKTASNFYVALADLVEHTLEKLNRFGDRHRVKERAFTRKPRPEKVNASVDKEDFEDDFRYTAYEQSLMR